MKFLLQFGTIFANPNGHSKQSVKIKGVKRSKNLGELARLTNFGSVQDTYGTALYQPQSKWHGKGL